MQPHLHRRSPLPWVLRGARDKNRSAPALRPAARSRRRRWAPLHHSSPDHPPTPTPSWRGLPPLCRRSPPARDPHEAPFFRPTPPLPGNARRKLLFPPRASPPPPRGSSYCLPPRPPAPPRPPPPHPPP